ncbi:MAG: bifunctional hydroxymethylpyrimidine kinase/phosphomethylpyrimidine kinase [Bacteroidota bacterium]
MGKTPNLKVLCVHSYAVHRTASSKAALSLLGSHLLPVPSLMLSGLTNLDAVFKFEIPFEELLKATFRHAQQFNQRLILFIGYLGKPEQVDILLECIEEHKHIIDHILVDPVSGDHDRRYVPEEIIQAWPKLLSIADWSTPNLTEVKLLSGLSTEEDHTEQAFITAFRDRFPNLSTIITSLSGDGQIGISVTHRDSSFTHWHEKLSQNFGGTGDVFSSQFIRYFFLQKMGLDESVEKAAEDTLAIVKSSIEAESKELLIYPFS